ncbi:hypothetical protein F3Y22_tig00117016pilonHSYRG00689 [Hibiscus syriacus]|uniref:RFTS domain-containing protein n=1 Tax=Hibiscus syriacus TaxID=106335 RepID=A0A6A2XC12_HIBSY|nr:hypothetical protein F3Y22_tig00117016pilonHSYRG00689 [Hibiscus syriacus]
MLQDTSAKSAGKKATDKKVQKRKIVPENGDPASKRPKRAAACTDFKEKSVCISDKDSIVESKKDMGVDDEIVDVRLTCENDEGRLNRRLNDFVLHNSEGLPQPLEIFEVNDMFIIGLILPFGEISDKEKEKSVRCEGFGQVYKKLSKSSSRNPDLSLDLLLAGVVRSMSGSKIFSRGASIKDFVISHGDFIYNQLIGLDETSKNDQVFVGLPVLAALRDESSMHENIGQEISAFSSGTLTIDSRLVSLELLPMKPCANIDVTIFCSGVMTVDDGSGFCLDVDLSQSTSGSSSGVNADGIPIFLSSIKEMMIEFGSLMVFISIRADMAWYRLGNHQSNIFLGMNHLGMNQNTEHRTERVTISIITLLKEQSRVSRLSFNDVVRRVFEFKKDNCAFISTDLATVERYIVVHGHIILQLFAEFPDEKIKNVHLWLALPIKWRRDVIQNEEENKDDDADADANGDVGADADANGDVGADANANGDASVGAEEDNSKETKKSPSVSRQSRHCSKEEVRWDVEPIIKTGSSEPFYKQAFVHGEVDVVEQAIFIDIANEKEVFLTNNYGDFELENVKHIVVVNIRVRPWGYQHWKANANMDKLARAEAEEWKRKGLPIKYYCKSLLYFPERGAVFNLPFDTLALGSGFCHSCQVKDVERDREIFKVDPLSTCFVYMGTEYSLHDYVYVSPHEFILERDEIEYFKSGRNIGLKPYVVCQVLEIIVPKGHKKVEKESTQIKVRIFFRPEDITYEKAYVELIDRWSWPRGG